MSISKDEIKAILMEIGQESTCVRRKVGAILVDKKGYIVKAYNGNLLKPCTRDECLRYKLKIKPGITHSLCYGIHAEIRLVLNCLEAGIDIKGATIYCTYSPCVDCAAVLATYGIKAFYFLYEYPDNKYVSIFRQANIEFGLIFK